MGVTGLVIELLARKIKGDIMKMTGIIGHLVDIIIVAATDKDLEYLCSSP